MICFNWCTEAHIQDVCKLASSQACILHARMLACLSMQGSLKVCCQACIKQACLLASKRANREFVKSHFYELVTNSRRTRNELQTNLSLRELVRARARPRTSSYKHAAKHASKHASSQAYKTCKLRCKLAAS